MEFKVVKREFGGIRKYYFKGSDGKIYGEGYDNCYFYREKMGRKRLTVVEGFALVRKGDEITGYWYLVDVDNGFKLYDINAHMQSLCGTGDVAPIFDWVATKPFLEHRENCWYINIKELRKTGSSHDYKYDEYREGFNVVYENGKYYFIDEDFKLHGEGYDEAYFFSGGFTVVKKDGKGYYVNREEIKKTGTSHLYKYSGYREGFNVVYENDQYYFIDEDFKLHGEGYDYIDDFEEGFAGAKKAGKWYFVDDKDFKLHGEGYDEVYAFSEGFAGAKKAGKWYFVDDKDFKLHGEGYDKVYAFSEGFAKVKKGEQEYTINENFERIKRNNQIMEDVDYLQEAKDDVKSIVGIPAIRFSDDFVNKLKAIVLNYYEKEVEEAKSNKVEALRSEMEYIKKIIDEKKEQYSEKVADPNYQSLLKQAQSLFEKSEEKSEEKPEENLDEEQSD